MNPFDTARIREEITPKPVSKSIMNWGPKTPWNPISNTMEDTTAINPSPPLATQTATNSGPHLGAETTGVTALAMIWAATAMGKEIQEPLPTGRHTVVIPKNRRPRKVLKQKIMVMWQNFTFPCSYSDQLTPAILLEEIGKSSRVTPGSLIKVILTSQNCPMGTLNFESLLSQQGIRQGDTLIMLVRQAKVHDPHNVQNLTAYREEDVMQHFLTALVETCSIPTLSNCVIFHGDFLLDLASRFQDCNLPHEPTLYVRFSSGLDVPPSSRPETPKLAGDADDQRDGPVSPLANTVLPSDNSSEPQKESQKTGNTGGDRVMALLVSPSQTLVQDSSGKTRAILFYPQDSVAENLKRHSMQIHLPPPTELYILRDSRIIQTDLTGAENGLPRDPYLRIILQRRGGMRGGPRSSTQGGSVSRGRGYRSSK